MEIRVILLHDLQEVLLPGSDSLSGLLLPHGLTLGVLLAAHHHKAGMVIGKLRTVLLKPVTHGLPCRAVFQGHLRCFGIHLLQTLVFGLQLFRQLDRSRLCRRCLRFCLLFLCCLLGSTGRGRSRGLLRHRGRFRGFNAGRNALWSRFMMGTSPGIFGVLRAVLRLFIVLQGCRKPFGEMIFLARDSRGVLLFHGLLAHPGTPWLMLVTGESIEDFTRHLRSSLRSKNGNAVRDGFQFLTRFTQFCLHEGAYGIFTGGPGLADVSQRLPDQIPRRLGRFTHGATPCAVAPGAP